MPVDIGKLTPGDFEARVNEDFVIVTPSGEVHVKLVEVRRLGQALREGGAFSLTFLSPPGPFLPQAIYALHHPVRGSLDLFLVPLGPKDGGNCYEAVFT